MSGEGGEGVGGNGRGRLGDGRGSRWCAEVVCVGRVGRGGGRGSGDGVGEAIGDVAHPSLHGSRYVMYSRQSVQHSLARSNIDASTALGISALWLRK